MVFKIRITNISGKRVLLGKRFKTKTDAKKFKNKILDAKFSAINRRGKSALTGFNPRVIKLKRRKK